MASSFNAFIEYQTQDTKSTGLSFAEWLNQLDAILHSHIGKTHADFDYDWDWHWSYNDEPAMWKAEDIIRRALPHSFNDMATLQPLCLNRTLPNRQPGDAEDAPQHSSRGATCSKS